jgi:hypothetical protein
MIFPYFKLFKVFNYLYVDLLDTQAKHKDGQLGSYVVYNDKKYSYILKINKTDESTNSVLGLYISINLFEEDNVPGLTKDDVKHLFTIEYFYNWNLNFYQKTKSYTSTNVKAKFWRNPLKWCKYQLIDMLRKRIMESIKGLNFQQVFNCDKTAFAEYFPTTIDRTIKEKPAKKSKKKKSKKKKQAKSTEEKSAKKPRPKKQPTKQKKNIKGE